MTEFKLRIVSSILLITISLLAVFAGGIVFNVLLILLSVLMIWEWNNLCHTDLSVLGVLLSMMVASVICVSAIGDSAIGLVAMGCALPFVWVLTHILDGQPKWAVIGMIYVCVPCIAAVWLRNYHILGLEIVLWLMLVVWGTDIGAYFTGVKFGGPKLAPSISPHKTWSGLLGGILCAAIVGFSFAWLLGISNVVITFLSSAGLAIIAQTGDLFESKVKRHFGAKDSGNLIPGHGGVLDRLDGLLAVLPVVAGAILIA